LDQARREVATRFDFKATDTTFERQGEIIVVESSTEDRARAAVQVLREKAARRQLSAKLFKVGEAALVGKGRGKIEIQLNAGINDETAKLLQSRVRAKAAKAQVKIQGDQLRVSSKSKDELQAIMQALKEDDSIPIPLQFTNYR
ncbi:MAG: DUF520 family protein, partial [Candidatus Dormibacteraceae bacterium]